VLNFTDNILLKIVNASISPQPHHHGHPFCPPMKIARLFWKIGRYSPPILSANRIGRRTLVVCTRLKCCWNNTFICYYCSQHHSAPLFHVTHLYPRRGAILLDLRVGTLLANCLIYARAFIEYVCSVRPMH